LDEIHLFDKWYKWIKAFYDREKKAKIYSLWFIKHFFTKGSECISAWQNF